MAEQSTIMGNLRRFLDAAAAEGHVFDGVDAADMYIACFGEGVTPPWAAPAGGEQKPVAWSLTVETARALAAELVRGAESMSGDEDDYELVLEVRRPGTVSDDDGKLNERPILAISDAEYPEEGVYPIDPADPTGGRVDAAPAPAALTEAEIYEAMVDHCDSNGYPVEPNVVSSLAQLVASMATDAASPAGEAADA